MIITIFKIIIAVAAIVVAVLIWFDKIKPPTGRKDIPLALVGLIAAFLYFGLEIFKNEQK